MPSWSARANLLAPAVRSMRPQDENSLSLGGTPGAQRRAWSSSGGWHRRRQTSVCRRHRIKTPRPSHRWRSFRVVPPRQSGSVEPLNLVALPPRHRTDVRAIRRFLWPEASARGSFRTLDQRGCSNPHHALRFANARSGTCHPLGADSLASALSDHHRLQRIHFIRPTCG